MLELKSDTENDDINMSDTSEPLKTTILKQEPDNSSSEDEDIGQKENIIESQLSLESCSIFYVAGYLVTFLMKKTGCNICKSLLLDETPILNVNGKDLLILHRDYGISDNEICYLTKPKEPFYESVEYILKEFDIALERFKIEYQIIQKIKDHLLKSMKRIGNSVMERQCSEHRRLIVDQIVKIKLFRSLKWMNQKSDSRPINLTGKYEYFLKFINDEA